MNVTGGTLNLGAADRLADSAAVTLGTGGTLGMGAFTDTVGTLATTGGTLGGTGTLTAATYGLGGGTINANLGAGTLNHTASTALNGTAAATTVNVTGGTLALGAASGLTGTNVSINVNTAGTLNLGASDQLADTAAVTLGTGGTLGMGAFTDTVGTLATTGGTLGGTGTLTAATYGLGGGTINANLGAGTINHTASTGLNGTAAATTVNVTGGTLALEETGRLATGATVAINSATLSLGGNETVNSVSLTSGTLTSSASATLTAPVTVNGAGNVLSSAATLTLPGVFNVGGSTPTFTVTTGTVDLRPNVLRGAAIVNIGATLNAAGAIGASVSNAGTLGISNTGALNFDGSVTGVGAINVTGSGGAVTFSNAANSFSGPFSINRPADAVTLRNNAATTLGNVTVANLTLGSVGAVTQAVGSAMVVTNTTSIVTGATSATEGTGNAAITLANNGNNFGTIGLLKGSVVDVHDGSGGVQLGTINAQQALVTAKAVALIGGQAISQTSGTSWTVPDLRLFVLKTDRSAVASDLIISASIPIATNALVAAFGNGSIGREDARVRLSALQTVSLGFGDASGAMGTATFVPVDGSPGNFLTRYTKDNTKGLQDELARPQSQFAVGATYDVLQTSVNEQVEQVTGTGVVKRQLGRDSQLLGTVAREVEAKPGSIGVRPPEGLGEENVLKRRSSTD